MSQYDKKVKSIPTFRVIALVTLFAQCTPIFAQNNSDSSIDMTVVVLLLFMAVMMLSVFMALIFGDKVIKLSLPNPSDRADRPTWSLLPGKEELFPRPVHKVAGRAHVIQLKKGFDIKLVGKAAKKVKTDFVSNTYAIKPGDFQGLQPIPKMLVKEGDTVKAGDKLFYDRKMDNVFFTAPVSGEIVEIKRGNKRAITEVVILADQKISYKSFKKAADIEALTRDEVIEQLIDSGSWLLFTQRPFGIPANPDVSPKCIHISTFDTSPLAVDYNFIFDHVEKEAFQAGIDVLNKLTEEVHLNLSAKRNPHNTFLQAKGCTTHWFEGPHPAGNVGVQIHHTTPINKGEHVWTIKPEDVATIGRLFMHGKYDPVKFVAVAGAPIKEPQYIKTRVGANIETMVSNNLKQDHVRFVSGNLLSGSAIEKKGHLGFYDNQLSVVEEGDFHEMFGWILPQYARPSISPTMPWKMVPFMQFEANTNTHGEPRAFVVTGQYESVTPMDLYPQHLLKAIMYNDFDEMEGLGIYEVIEEDLALCEFVCTSKQPVQEVLREGLDYIRSQS